MIPFNISAANYCSIRNTVNKTYR